MANIFSRLFGGKKALTGTNLAVAPQAELRSAIRFLGGQLVPYNVADRSVYIDKGYTYNDIIYSVVKMILDKAVVATWAPYTVVDEKAYFKSRAILKKLTTSKSARSDDFKEALFQQQKGLKPSDDPIGDLLYQPNENDTFSDLNFGHWCYKLITGDYFEAGWDSAASGGLRQGVPLQLYGTPSQYMRIKTASGTLPLTPETYELYYGYIIPFTKQDILHEKYFNPEWDSYGIQLYGLSPLKAYLKRLQRNNLAQIRGSKAMENAGADVAVYLDDQKLQSDFDTGLEQMSTLKRTWDDEQSGADNAAKAVWSAYKLGVARLGLSPVELALLESEKFDQERACHIYGVPAALFSTDASTYNNLATSERALTTRCALPLILSRESSFNRKLRTLPRYASGRTVIAPDLTCYTELEEQKKDQVDWVMKAPLPLSRKLEILGEDVPEWMTDEQKNAIIIPSGFQLLDDLFIKADDLSTDMQRLQDEGALPYADE